MTYWFRRDGRQVKKTVRWFLMRPLEKAGDHDHEVDEVLWTDKADALARLRYDSDRRLVGAVTESTKPQGAEPRSAGSGEGGALAAAPTTGETAARRAPWPDLLHVRVESSTDSWRVLEPTAPGNSKHRGSRSQRSGQ